MKKTFIAGALSLTCLAPIAGCAYGPDDSNTFTITGDILRTDPDYMIVGHIAVISATGTSIDRLKNDGGTEIIHDNYNDIQCYRQKTSDDLDNLRDTGKLAIGTHVEVTASVGETTYDCMPRHPLLSQDRSILESMKVVEQ